MKTFKSSFLAAVTVAVLGVASAGHYLRNNGNQLVLGGILLALGALGVLAGDPVTGMGIMLAGSVLDVFKQSAFDVTSLTDSVNKQPFVPGRAGQVINWDEQGVPTTTILIEEYQGVLQIINPSPRGGAGATSAKEKRTARSLTIPHYEHNDAVYADEVQGVREFGSESQMQTVQGLVNRRLLSHVQLKLDPTLEYQRIGAIKGVILNGDGSTLYDLFAEFGVSQDAEIDFNLDVDGSATGALRTLCNQVARTVAGYMEGQPFQGIYAFCGDTFFDSLINNPEVVRTYLNQQEASQLRGNLAYQTFDFGGIRWENYRGAVGGTPFVATDKCHIFPVGTPGWRTIYAPADYIETVNTVGLPRYARQFEMQNGKGVNLDTQMNALNYFVRPKALLKGRRT